jgi:hypothetical protein
MKRIRTFLFLLVLVSFVSTPLLYPQSASTTATPDAQLNTSGFPQWLRDLRRWEIIAFGVFPFAYFFASFGYDTYRFASNDWDRRFAPWPLNSAGTIEKTQEEHLITIGLAAGTALLIGLVDHGIMRARRNRMARESRNLQEGSPIIIRRPLFEDELEVSEVEPRILTEDNGLQTPETEFN